MTGHSDWAPSACDAWSRCFGRVNATRGLPRRSSKASALGTAKHETSYWCLMHTDPKMTADTLLGRPWTADGFAGTIDQEFVDHVNTYLIGVRKAANWAGTNAWYELTLDTSPVYQIPDQSGTGDAVLCRYAARNLYVGDAKFGFGAVSPRLNRQMLSYAAAALLKFDEFNAEFDSVTMAILQPRISDEPQEFTVRAHLVRRWARAIAIRAQKTLPADAPRIPGPKQCQWCGAKPDCKAIRQKVLDSFPIDEAADALGAPQPHIPPVVPAMLNEALADSLDLCDMIEAWTRDVRAEALRRANAGQTIPGYKVIIGRQGNREFWDDGAAQAMLEAEGVDPFTKPKVISPTEAQRRLKAAGKSYEAIEPLVTQAPGSPSLAKVTEPGRPVPRLEFGLETE